MRVTVLLLLPVYKSDRDIKRPLHSLEITLVSQSPLHPFSLVRSTTTTMPSKSTSSSSSKVSSTKTSGKAKPVATKVSAAPIASTTPSIASSSIAETITAPPTISPVQTRITQLQTIVSTLLTQVREVNKELTSLQKDYAKEQRVWKRQQEKLMKKKAKSNKGNAHHSGIAKPAYISKELCSFIGVNADTKMARTEVIKFIDKYIKDHKLQDAKNKKVIVPDAKLRKLLRSDPKKDEVTYFNLQTYMKPHYADPAKVSATA